MDEAASEALSELEYHEQLIIKTKYRREVILSQQETIIDVNDWSGFCYYLSIEPKFRDLSNKIFESNHHGPKSKLKFSLKKRDAVTVHRLIKYYDQKEFRVSDVFDIDINDLGKFLAILNGSADLDFLD